MDDRSLGDKNERCDDMERGKNRTSDRDGNSSVGVDGC